MEIQMCGKLLFRRHYSAKRVAGHEMNSDYFRTQAGGGKEEEKNGARVVAAG
jgi:hypothetical protein